jgi:hypothetical protein
MSVVVTPIITATKAEWMATTAPIVKDRVVYETDTGNYKVGDGTSIYSSLPYAVNYATFTNYIFMVPLDEIGALFVGGSSQTPFELWSPGVPAMSTVVGENVTVIGGNGTLSSSSTTGVWDISATENPGKLLQFQFGLNANSGNPQGFGAVLFPIELDSNGNSNVLMNANLASQLFSQGNSNYAGNIIGFGFSDGTNTVAVGHWFWENQWGYSGVFTLQGGFVEPTTMSVDPNPYQYPGFDQFAAENMIIQGTRGVRYSNNLPDGGTVFTFNQNTDAPQSFGVGSTPSNSPFDLQPVIYEMPGNGFSLNVTGQLYFCILIGNFSAAAENEPTNSYAETVLNIYRLQTSGFLNNLPKAPGY